MERRKKTILVIGFAIAVSILLIIIAIIMVPTSDSGLAKRRGEQMILTSIDLPGTWERAPFPIEYVPVPGTVLDQANTVFWMNNSKGSEAAIFIEIHGFASVDGANGSYHGTVEHVSWDYVSTLNFGDQGCSFEKTNASISCHGKEVIWSHGYYMVFQKMNYWVGMVIVSQDSYNITSNQVERLAQVQELAVT